MNYFLLRISGKLKHKATEVRNECDSTVQTRSQILGFGKKKDIFRCARFCFYYMFKTIFLGTTQFGGHKKYQRRTASECLPWLPAWHSGNRSKWLVCVAESSHLGWTIKSSNLSTAPQIHWEALGSSDSVVFDTDYETERLLSQLSRSYPMKKETDHIPW